MMRTLSRLAPAAGLGLVALLVASLPASAQRRIPPASRVIAIDSATVPSREPIIAPPAPVGAVPTAQRTPVEVEPLRPLQRTPAPVDPARVATADSVVALPPPLERQPAPAPQAVMSPVMALRSTAASTVAPAGATGRCKDGTYLTSAASEGACTDRGGLAVIFPPPRATPQVRQ